MAVTPVIYGQSARPPRGDYSRAREDYTCDQNYAGYSAQDHALYAHLLKRQSALLPGLACEAFIQALPQLGESHKIPHFDDINARLMPATGWQIVAVPGLIPEVAFFTQLGVWAAEDRPHRVHL
jgi:phenylalanine-4-hydroxylase